VVNRLTTEIGISMLKRSMKETSRVKQLLGQLLLGQL